MISYINPKWVEYTFKHKYWSLMQICKGRWYSVPAGCRDSDGTEAPGDICLKDVWIKYHQKGDQETCLFYAIANALHLKGGEYQTSCHHFANKAYAYEYHTSDRQIVAARVLMAELYPKIAAGKTWLPREKFDILEEKIRGDDIMILQLYSKTDCAVNHVVAVVGDVVLDSVEKHGLRLCKKSLDRCCGVNDEYGGCYRAFTVCQPNPAIKINYQAIKINQ